MSLITGVFPGLQEQPPLHAGERFLIWDHLLKAKGCQAKYQLLGNHADDAELADYLADIAENMVKKEVSSLEAFLLENGVEPPPASPANPKAARSDIPAGARFSDQEIAMCVYHDLAGALAQTSLLISVAVREDVGKIFLAHHQEIAKYGGTLLKLMKKKGWLVEPPR
ncbi:DUF3231 family protein [Anaeroselena agilis]|uniref:DUF3231 family protein n=1 Tax=Anaeroselena agilis TaxID=3063788 RepID=A0ABU3NT13_9FIRM|nr:DUF3231 family protein [Selenomonadales bacterium 4137-cl]